MKKELFVEMTSAEMQSVNGGAKDVGPAAKLLWEIAKAVWDAINSDGKPQV